jgi:outer membrane protein OmpA-like peptidoglycan-associated protein
MRYIFSFKILIILTFTIFTQACLNLFAKDTAEVTILLMNKKGHPLQNLAFDLKDKNYEIISNALTDEKGEYHSMMKKGENYNVFFKYYEKEWNFNLEVPNKPGKRAYTYYFKIHLEETEENAYRSNSIFEKNIDSSACEVNIQLRNQEGTPLPHHQFSIFTKDGSSINNLISDEKGNYGIILKKGNRYDLLSEFDGLSFMTYFQINKNDEYLNITFNIDAKPKIDHTYLDSTLDAVILEKNIEPIKTIIKVINKEGRVIEDAEVVLKESNKKILTDLTDKTGQVYTKTDRRKVYEIIVRKLGITFEYKMVLPEDESIKEYTFIAEVDFYSEPIRIFKLNAYFDTDKYILRPESFKDLNNLLKMMEENMDLIIIVQGHTDDRGSEKHNQILSENRARSVKNWLKDHYIDPSRIEYIGYGESRPCATNSTAEGRQLNRRIEVGILAE